MAATERVVVLMSHAQKAEVAERARADGISVGDYMRRAALEDDDLIEPLLEELRASTQRAAAALDVTLSRLADVEARQDVLEAAAYARARAEFGDLDLDAARQLFGAGA